jgi:hypothetical protein
MFTSQIDFGLGHFGRMADMVKKDMLIHPLATGVFYSWAVVAGKERFFELVQQFRG